MVKVGKKIVKFRVPILILSIILLIPAVWGYVNTRINYDVLTYLPEDIETMQGQEIMTNDFGIGAFSMLMVDGMEDKDIVKLKEKVEKVDGVANVLWYDSLADISVPQSMLPSKLYDEYNTEDGTMMAVFFKDGTSSDETMKAVTEIRKVTGKECFLSGMSAIVEDTKELAEKETPLYVLIAVALSALVLAITMESIFVPVLFLLSIGIAIVYNLGTNVFFGEISYITKALAAVLQLGVTMDYSIFLMHSYQEQQVRYNGDKERAMAHAISQTFSSVIGSSVTTVAGFIALCFMSFTLGKDIGIVMAKGVIIGVLCCVTILPAMILIFDKPIEKTKHKPLIKSMDKASAFITKHYKVWIVAFLILLIPAIYGNNHTKIYYNIAQSLPQSLPSNVANSELKDDFDMSTMHIVMIDKDMDAKEKKTMMSEIDDVKGVKWTLGLNSIVGSSIPESMIPDDVKSMLQGKDTELMFVCTKYESATPQVNRQIKQIDKIVKSYDKSGMVIGEAPLMKDLQDVTDIDLTRVNVISIAAIFIIILLIFKSISLPIILVSVIEFAITINMAIPFYQGKSLPFVASIVIGAIQLGATVDYAILMTTRYQKERMKGKSKKESVAIAHRISMPSIITSGLSFFAATFGVTCYTQVDMIGSICELLSRGAIISVIVVLTVLPAMFLIFDPVICRTTAGYRVKKDKSKTVAEPTA